MSIDPNDLTSPQKKYLKLLLYSHIYYGNPIKSEWIASRTNRHKSTVRRHIQSLVHMQLAESIPGPNGGYKPTTVGYNVLRLDDNLATKSVELQYNDSCEKIEVVNFNIINANNLNNCRIEIYIGNNIERFSDIDHIEVDVLTNPRLHIEGEIEMLNPVMNQLLANVDSFSTLSE